VSKRKGPRQPVFDSGDALLDASVDAELDLHGYTTTEVPSALRAFLQTWQRRKSGAVVQVITGRGKGSANGPVLRGFVKNLLQGELRTIVGEWGLDDGEGGYRVRLR
jgi:DNA-nicking Smr family endonuclease